VTRSPLSVVSVDCTLPAAGAAISAPAATPALGSVGLALLIETEPAGAADPVAGVTVGVGALVWVGATVGVDVAVVEPELSAGGGLVDDEDVAAGEDSVEEPAGSEETEVEDGSEVVACGAGLLTVVVVAGAGVSVDAASGEGELDPALAGVSPAPADAVAPESGGVGA
jgi:hypothetical protein